MNELTQDQKNKLMVAAQAFFRDGQGDEDYPHKDVSEQYEEFKSGVECGEISWRFIESVFNMNS